jgi:hypothetical protein
MSQEETVTNHKMEANEDPLPKDKGKSSDVLIATNQVTLKEIADSLQDRILTIDKLKAPCVPDKPIQVKMVSTPLTA